MPNIVEEINAEFRPKKYATGRLILLRHLLQRAVEQKENLPFVLAEVLPDVIALINKIKENQLKLSELRKSGAWRLYVSIDGKSARRGTVDVRFLKAGFSLNDWSILRNVSHSNQTQNRHGSDLTRMLQQVRAISELCCERNQRPFELVEALMYASLKGTALSDELAQELEKSKVYRSWKLLSDQTITSVMLWKLKQK